MIFIYKIYKKILKNYDERAAITQEKLNLPYFQCGHFKNKKKNKKKTAYLSSN